MKWLEHFKGLIPKEIPTVLGDLPSNSSNIVSLTPMDGEDSTYFLGNQGPLIKPYIRCVTRSKSSTMCTDWLDKLHALDRYEDDMFGVVQIGSPEYLGRDEDKLVLFQIVFKLILKE